MRLGNRFVICCQTVKINCYENGAGIVQKSLGEYSIIVTNVVGLTALMLPRPLLVFRLLANGARREEDVCNPLRRCSDIARILLEYCSEIGLEMVEDSHLYKFACGTLSQIPINMPSRCSLSNEIMILFSELSANLRKLLRGTGWRNCCGIAVNGDEMGATLVPNCSINTW